MKSIQITGKGGLDTLSVIETDTPTPAAGQVLVRWHASSLNFHDYLVAKGAIPVPDGRVPMSDGAGVIEAVGEGVSRWQVGDQVMSLFFPNWLDGVPTLDRTSAISGETADGFAATHSVQSEQSLTSIPKGYSFAEAATLPCAALTAWRALVVEGNIKAGDSVLVEGTGGMSIFALQMAKAAGAYVYATTSRDDKTERLKALGADDVINYREDERWGRTIFKKSGGVDHVLDVGGTSTISQSIEAVAIYGNISLIGILGGREASMIMPKLFFKHVHLNGLAVGSRTMQDDMVSAIDVAGWKPVIDKSFALDELGDAFRYQESGDHFGKIVVEF